VGIDHQPDGCNKAAERKELCKMGKNWYQIDRRQDNGELDGYEMLQADTLDQALQLYLGDDYPDYTVTRALINGKTVLTATCPAETSGYLEAAMSAPVSQKPQYCTQPSVESCNLCNLTNYGLDCANNPVNKKPMQRRKDSFEQFAIAQGVHNGPHTLSDLHQLRKDHKGSRWITIVELFKARGIAAKAQGVEIIDGSDVWIDSVGKLIPLDVLRRLNCQESRIETVKVFDGNLCDSNDFYCQGDSRSPMRGYLIAQHVPRNQWDRWARTQIDYVDKWELID